MKAMFNFDLTNKAHAQAFATVMAMATANEIPFDILNDVSGAPVKAQVSAPVEEKPKKALDPAKDVTIPITRVKAGKGQYALTIGSGDGRKGAQYMVRDAGFKWDQEFPNPDSKYGKGAYVGTTEQAKALGLNAKSTEIAVSAQWVQYGRDKAKAKAERNAK